MTTLYIKNNRFKIFWKNYIWPIYI